MIENILPIMKTRKKTYYSIWKKKNTKEAYTNGSKSIENKVGFNVTKNGALLEEASILTTEMTAIKIALMEIHKRWIIYTNF